MNKDDGWIKIDISLFLRLKIFFASMYSKTLFIIVEESIEIFYPFSNLDDLKLHLV